MCFAALKGDPLASSKKSDPGIDERLDLLDEFVEFDARPFYEETRSTYREPAYAPSIGSEDDIVDALVAAVSAASTEEALPSLPRESSEYDDVLDREIEINLPVT